MLEDIMLSPNKKQTIIIIIAASILCLFGVKRVIWDNPETLFLIAEGFDEPSAPYYVLIERAYKIYSNGDHQNLIANFLNESENKHLINTYIRTVGVIGDTSSKVDLINLYRKYDNRTYEFRLHSIIKSLGLLGAKDAVPFLEGLLFDQEKVVVSRSTIAVSLYLITGKEQYRFVNIFGNEQALILSEDLKRARQVILNSKNRKRTYHEMIVLDNLFRSPDYRKTFEA